MRKVIVVALLAVVSAGCSLWSGDPDKHLEKGRILFESFRLEMEWGYELKGIYIDSDGLVWSYQRDKPWYPAEMKSSVVRESDLLSKYADSKRVGSIDPRVLREKVALIDGAAGGRVMRDPLSFERSGGLDVAYVFDSREARYNQVFLAGTGDWVAKNFSVEARDLVAWLGEVKRSVGFE